LNEKADEDIREDTMRSLNWSPLLDADDITLTVDNGIVTLEGTVDTWQDRKSAGHHAGRAGARSVKNKLKVRVAGQ
jgi:osmotically-inducible protein OsmY